MERSKVKLKAVGILLVLIATPAGSQTDIRRASIDGGGGNSSAENYRIRGTIGQFDAGVLSAGPYLLRGGLALSPGAQALPDLIFQNSFEEHSP